MSTTLFDKKFDYNDANQQLTATGLEGKIVRISTVRQARTADLALGNVLWLVQGMLALRAGAAKLVITDFYDKANSNNQGIKDLMSALGMNQDPRIELQRAEDIAKNTDLWKRFCDYVRENKSEKDNWETIGTISEGIDEVIASEDYSVPKTMERFLEELSVWVDGIDSNTVQLLHHEAETTAWIRRLYPGASKEFLQLLLPFQNEYRGKYKVIIDGESIIVQRRLQDLPEKLAQRRSGNDVHAQFYERLFQELISIIDDVVQADKAAQAPKHKAQEYEIEYYEQYIKGPTKPEDIMGVLLRIDPRLVVFYLETLSENEIQQIRIPTELNHDMNTETNILRAYGEAMALIAKAIIDNEQNDPSLNRLKKLAAVARLNTSHGPSPILNNRDLLNTLLNEKIPIGELCAFWTSILESELNKSSQSMDDLRNSIYYKHPILDKIVKNRSKLSQDQWQKLKNIYLKDLSGEHMPLVGSGDPLICTDIIPTILNELEQTDPAKLLAIVRFKSINYTYKSKQDLAFLRNVLERYKRSNDPDKNHDLINDLFDEIDGYIQPNY